MTKKTVLKLIAETAYDTGFGAKKHFATYDIVSKMPGIIGFVSMAVGILALVFDSLGTKGLSAAFIVLGVLGIYISVWEHKKQSYADIGKRLTRLLDRLKILYFKLNDVEDDAAALEAGIIEVEQIKSELHEVGDANQICLSDWYAHYKFFWQHQIAWIDEQLKFRFWRDKIPLSFSLMLVFSTILLIALAVWKHIP